jgi:cell wall-associated NlpC family hydrolase
MAQLSPVARLGAVLLGLLVFGTGCQWLLTATQLAGQPPRMTCPTPTALPTMQVEDGEDSVIVAGTPTTRTRYRDTAPYEREYGLPVVTPTPYIREAASFPLGTIVNLGGGVDARLTVAPRNATRRQGEAQERLYRVSVEWSNPGTPFSFDPYRQLAVTQVQQAGGRIRGGLWRWSPEAAVVSDLPAPASALETTTQIPTGRSTTHVDLFAPAGQATVAELRLDAALAQGDGGAFEDLRVQFVAGPADPNCATNGLFGAAPDPERQAAQPVQGPVVVATGDTHPAVAAALTQLGRPYCWGGKGWTPCSGCGGGRCYAPCSSSPCWDCSGLTNYAWAQAGVSIGHGSSNQSARLPRVPRGEPLQAGDVLFFFSAPGSGAITHVTLNAGDVNGNGTPDMVEAAWYGIPLRVVDNWPANPYFAARFAWAGRPQ